MGTVLDQIKAAKDLGQTQIRIEEWGVDLLIIEPSRKVILDLQQKHKIEVNTKTGAAEGDLEGFGMESLVMMVHDLDGVKVFENVEQAKEVLNDKSSKVYAKLVEACQNFAKEPDNEKIEDAEGNSEGIQS